ncbi:6-phosphogluconate dehydrogenase C-terminal domain-like protein [Stereum hirsutum FP-91666 SS1]|uniref:6-phosphogluconate dehydrogenase C-terminal domain-like protein n=1 Tax=Stereum hirsutum (strain FP-91666) TaxID=721885 RepID=UPI000440D402|nr:6-phosphogluconate dehydrogenase C-terminal domain-like protein [Stereum hirsutum FP-91666 SS1]EIM91496.1 6-phosphogluconate dehydrogenase C-terminal domain-like protein [Stereum hirsutum FP-91666 SS1]
MPLLFTHATCRPPPPSLAPNPNEIVDQRSLNPYPLAVHVSALKPTSNLSGYLERKLFTLNTGHACTAYFGSLLLYLTIDAAIKDKRVCEVVLGALEEGGGTLVRRYGLEAGLHHRYVLPVLKRFENLKLKEEVMREMAAVEEAGQRG